MMHNGKLLLVEDDLAVQELLQVNLSKDGWAITAADSGETALLKVAELVPDLIVLDLMLPGMDGKQVCRQVRRYPKTSLIPIIMMSALSQDADVVAGFEMGADDYVTKPFSLEVLRARIQAVLRRSRERQEESTEVPVTVHNLVIDPKCLTTKVDGVPVSLSHADFLVLQMLAAEPGRVFTRRQIIEVGHGKDVDISDRSVDVQIVGLRRKIGAAGKYIETVRGVGYRLKEI
ncbi:response regulator transcription factor [Pontiellaceae bacterium B12227]|nr:response regulator transcription factor [Pontiellaceae bacterium B12227]